MPFIRSIELERNFSPSEFPFNLPVIKNFSGIEFSAPVTFLVGENGSGKSTILEALAVGLCAVAIGSDDLEQDQTLEAARNLAGCFRYVRNQSPRQSFFFRAEDSFGFTKRIMEEQKYLDDLEKEFSETLKGEGRVRAMGAARGQRMALEKKYGENPNAYSHGEGFLHVLQERLRPKGLYVMDEPETPLSPVRQLSLISMIKEKVEQSCQFVIATHSPILMAFPGAQIILIEGNELRSVSYEEVEHVSLTRSFLNNPEAFLRRL